MVLLVHGGAGERRPERKALDVLSAALDCGYRLLEKGGCALDAVQECIVIMENSGVLNAGSGSNLQLDGVRRLDAALMDGTGLKAGSVIGIEKVKNPIAAARILMDLPNFMMTNRGASNVARVSGLEELPEAGPRALDRLKRARRTGLFTGHYRHFFSTVGAVALDGQGRLSAGASTGGVFAMLPGRVGDTPVIGAGVYAENGLGAVSCTGAGESIIRLALAKEICMNLASLSVSRAARLSLKRVRAISGSAGVIVLNADGRHALMHTTRYMASGRADKRGIRVAERAVVV